jgi:hypothetical protein
VSIFAFQGDNKAVPKPVLFVGLKDETGFPNVHLRLLDLAKFSSVIDFADHLEKEEDRLDIVVANAAIARDYYEVTEDGWESEFVHRVFLEPSEDFAEICDNQTSSEQPLDTLVKYPAPSHHA